MSTFPESVVEDATLAWLEALGYAVLHGPAIAVGEPAAERSDPNYRDVVLEARLRQALVRLNPDLPPEAPEDAFRKLTRADALSLIERNRAAHRILVDGVTVEYRRADGSNFLGISKANFRPIRVVAPTAPIFAACQRMAGPVYALIVSNERRSRTLAALRDMLLSNLISGELRVKDAERIVAGQD